MITKKWLYTGILTMLLISLSFSAVFAQEINLEFFIGKTEYKTTEGTKVLEAAPYIKSSRTMVPMRAIFEELGYFVEYDAVKNRVISSNGFKRMILTIGSNKAIIDGVEKTMPVAAETRNGRTFVPLAFVSENSGATVTWIDLNNPITVKAASRPDIGNFIITEKKLDAQKKPLAILNIFRNGKAEKIEIPGKEITSVVQLNDSFVVTVLDPVLFTTQVMGYDGKLTQLLTDYDIKNSFEFNNNLVIHMYNRIKKIDELWRYDGSTLTLIDADFNMGIFVVNDKEALVSKSNSRREYSIMKFTKTSWIPQEIKASGETNGFIIKEYVVDGDIIYMLGTKAAGADAWFYTYRTSTGKLTPIKVPTGVKITLKDVLETDNYIYVKISGVLHVLKDDALKPVEFSENGSYVHVKLGDAKVINGELYGIVTGLVASIDDVKSTTNATTKVTTLTDVRYPATVLTGTDKTFMINIDNDIKFTSTTPFTNLDKKADFKNWKASSPLSSYDYFRNTPAEMTKQVNKDTKINTMTYFDNQLFLQGIDYAGDNYLRAWNVNTLDLGDPALDVKKILEIVKHPNGAYILAVEDLNRLNNTTRKTILELKNGDYRNIAVDTQVLQMVMKDASLMIYGKDIDLSKTKVFSYNGSAFNSVGNTFVMAKWFNYNNGLTFMSGKADAETKESVFLLTQSLKKVMPEFTLEKTVRLTQNIYGVVGKLNATVVDPDFKGKKLMVIFDSATNKYVVVKAATAFELTASEYK